MQLINSNNLEALKSFSSNSIDSIVTDPPYGISFMGKKWDYNVPSVETWKECLRVLKPGGHILVACGTRTQHRMAVNIEDAGFEIRDIVAWIYGSGFPKSHNIGKAVDKLQGNEREVVGVKLVGNAKSNKKSWKQNSELGLSSGTHIENETKGNSPYEGWGTALKPAMELWTMARKPLSEKNIVENVLKWGTGGINIDESRVGTDLITTQGGDKFPKLYGTYKTAEESTHSGRFPANIIHDGSDEVTDLFPNDSQRFFYCAKASKSERNDGLDGFEEKIMNVTENNARTWNDRCLTCKKKFVGSDETICHCPSELKITDKTIYKQKNNHPTVKPIALMSYLIKLITPTGGVVLDPFMGSGSTGVACRKEGFEFIGIELDEEYFKIAEARINNWTTT